ncbi:hypothetical protein IGK61_002559 [Enterococcus sp. AZ063]
MKKKLLLWCGFGCLPTLLLCMFGFLFMIVLISSGSEEEEIDCSPTEIVASTISLTNQGMETNGLQIAKEVQKHIPNTTLEGLAGMLGNFQQESSMSPTAIGRPNDPLSGHGIAQWTAGRTTALKNFAKERNKEWSDLGVQVEFLIHELNTTEKASQVALQAKSVEEATELWQVKFERAGIPMMGNRINFANQWYAKLGKNDSDPVASVTLENGANAGSKDLTDYCLETTGTSSSSDSNVLNVAKSLIGYFHYSQPQRAQFGSVENPDKNGYADCSSFVWLVLTKAGYKTPANVGWFTGSMTSDARGSKQYLQEIPESEAKAGDIIIVNLGSGVGNDGHTAVLAEDWHGLSTKVIEQGGMNNNGVGEGQVNLSFGYLLNGGDICFARPIKK